MIEMLKKIKRAIKAALLRCKVRHEARRALAYDRRQFMEHAGALHLDRKAT